MYINLCMCLLCTDLKTMFSPLRDLIKHLLSCTFRGDDSNGYLLYQGEKSMGHCN